MRPSKVTCILTTLMVAVLGIRAAKAAPAESLTVVKVTSLADSGAGTLRDCVSKTYPRLCVFEVSGRIALRNQLIIKQPNIIIAGQTAPSPGILLTGAGIIAQASHVTVEHLSVRVGDNPSGPPPDERDTISVWGPDTSNVTFRNISASWSVDENFSTWDTVSDIRVEDCILAEALYNSIHPKGSHSMGALVGTDGHRVNFAGNLFAANYDRNVRWKGGSDGTFISNVVFGWGGTSSWNITNVTDLITAKPIILDIIGNVFMPGPDGSQAPYVIYADTVPLGSKIFIADNIAPKLTNLASKILTGTRSFTNEPSGVPSNQTYDLVMKTAGSRPWERNPVDARILDGVANRNLHIRDKVDEWPVVAQNTRRLSPPKSVMTLDQIRQWLRGYEMGNDPAPTTTPNPPGVLPPPLQPTTPPDSRMPVPGVPTEVPPTDTESPSPGQPSAPGDRLSPPQLQTPEATPLPPEESPFPWLSSRAAWRRSARELCCTRKGHRELGRGVRYAHKPGIRRRCLKLHCR